MSTIIDHIPLKNGIVDRIFPNRRDEAHTLQLMSLRRQSDEVISKILEVLEVKAIAEMVTDYNAPTDALVQLHCGGQLIFEKKIRKFPFFGFPDDVLPVVAMCYQDIEICVTSNDDDDAAIMLEMETTVLCSADASALFFARTKTPSYNLWTSAGHVMILEVL
jgi:hypothetical protein